MISLARYLSLMAIVFVAAAATIDRQRAKRILYLLTATTTLIALAVLAIRLGGFTLLHNNNRELAADVATNMACLGVIVATATGFHIFETSELGKMRKPEHGRTVWSHPVFVASLVAVTICLFAVIVTATREAYFALLCGLATSTVVVLGRRSRFGSWWYSAIASLALFVAVAGIVLQLAGSKIDVTLAFATRAQAPLIALTQRILAETSWKGTGGGTFASVLPIYRGVDELTVGSVAPTAAAKIAVEMGRPFFWMLLAATIALAIVLLSCALRRGRDSCYSAAGASSIVTITLLAFGNASLFSTPVMVTASIIVGIAIAQSKSRSI